VAGRKPLKKARACLFFWRFGALLTNYQGAFKNTQNFLQKPTSKNKSKIQEEKTFFYIYMSFFLKVLACFFWRFLAWGVQKHQKQPSAFLYFFVKQCTHVPTTYVGVLSLFFSPSHFAGIWPRHQRVGDFLPQGSTSGAPAVPRSRPVFATQAAQNPREGRAAFKRGVLTGPARALNFAMPEQGAANHKCSKRLSILSWRWRFW
jgi:hypothetical protein